MKNINYVINGVLAVAVVILFIMQFSGKKESADTKVITQGGGDPATLLPVAYVNVDSLLQSYNFSKDLNEELLKQEENSRANVTQQARALEAEVMEFNRKIQNNAFLTRERAEQDGQRLDKKRQELQELNDKLTQELMAKRQKLNEQLRDSIMSQLKIYNNVKKYQIIFSNSMDDNILLADRMYDITPELVAILNKSYSGSK